mmetsp:Transcript_20675/g.9534  ORF Transcript_20675/g.9534 Transcript_20675/m.9534 type:complete len:202 (-) Transcript_20675:102-707(-)
MKKIFKIFLICTFILVVFGCASRKVSRVSSDKQTDYSGRWNDTDSRLVAEDMVKQLLSANWINEYNKDFGRKPVVIVGTIRLKDSNEHINTSTFIKDIERELVNSGKVKFVASSKERGEIRQERVEQQSNASIETVKRLAAETGADFILIGNISTFVDEYKKKQSKFYQIDLELINVESNEKVWLGSKEIKKLIGKKSNKW